MNNNPQHLIKLLETKGYLLRRIRGSHHILFHKELSKTIVVPVHGKKDISNGIFLSFL